MLRECRRRSPAAAMMRGAPDFPIWPRTSAKDGCFDWIEIPSKETPDHG
jgi:hypothetical protein